MVSSHLALDQGSANYSLWTKSGCQLFFFVCFVFLTKVLLQHRHARLRTHRLWLLPILQCGVDWVRQAVWPAKPELFTPWTFTENVCWLLALHV